MEIEKEYKSLIEIINKANLEYYTQDNPSLLDSEYDTFMKRLLAIEEMHPEFITENSPSQRVGYKTLEEFEKYTHTVPMLSLGNIFSDEEIRSFISKITANFGDVLFTVEPKIDGLAGNFVYENGEFVLGATRGDGFVGENITSNMMTIKTLPKKLKESVNMLVRGEIFMPIDTFNKLNEEKINAGENPFQNSRNAASGSIRQLDPKICKKRELSCFIYNLVNIDKHAFTSYYDSIMYLKDLNFNINPLTKLCRNEEEVIEHVKYLEENKDNLDYDIDGAVIKVDNITLHDSIGYTAKTPKWAVAYKFKAKEVSTKLLDIEFTVGRTGKITPNARLEPVFLSGSTISNATLHNANYILNKDIRVGDTVYIRKAAEIIPEVVSVIMEKRDPSSKKFVMIENCPICDSKLVKSDAVVDLYCKNELCPARTLEKLIHFASKNCMNIDGMGPSIVSTLVNEGFISTFNDIYNLEQYKEEIINLDRFGLKTYENLIDSINKSKEKDLSNLVFALGINGIGRETAKLLATNFNTLDNLINAELDELISIKAVGDVLANNVYLYFRDEENLEEIEKLKNQGLNTECLLKISADNTFFAGKTFVITGTFSMSRDEIKEKVEALGGKVSSSISQKTDCLIMGENAGSKANKAKEYNTLIIDEEKLLNLL